MRRREGMGAPEAASKLARCRSIFCSISSSDSGASEPYSDNMLKLTCAPNTALGKGLNESNATACFCNSSIPALPLAHRLKDFNYGAADRAGFLQMREQ